MNNGFASDRNVEIWFEKVTIQSASKQRATHYIIVTFDFKLKRNLEKRQTNKLMSQKNQHLY